MKFEPATRSGLLLWRLLPLVYRRWDGRGKEDPRHPAEQRVKGDLAEYLDAAGTLLDQLRGTLEQRLKDTSPDTCQPWLIPYFADLLDVRLVSPDVAGQREEVARAIAWRQRKGTLGGVAEIARAIGRLERVVRARGDTLETPLPTVVVHEGHRRVATTVTIGRLPPSLSSLGLSPSAFVPSGSPVHAALRPGLHPGTVDFRFLSRARRAVRETLATRLTAFGDEGVLWRQENPTGAPCHPDTYQDSSVRTPDMRAPDHARGHYHPHRVLLYAAARDGLFTPGALEVSWRALRAWFAPVTPPGQAPPFSEWEERGDELVRERLLRTLEFEESVVHVIERERHARSGAVTRELVAGLVALPGQVGTRRTESLGSEELAFIAGFELVEGTVEEHPGSPAVSRRLLRGFGERIPKIRVEAPDQTLELGGLGNAVSLQRFEHLVVLGTVKAANARLELARVALQDLEVDFTAAPSERLLVSAVDSLFDGLTVAGTAVCRFEYCTVLNRLACRNVEASDSILLGAHAPSVKRLYLRYSAAPWLPAALDAIIGRAYQVTREAPLFLEPRFGLPGSGVLHPGTSPAIRAGAEDGGELGAYHREHHVVREQAVLDKLREFLPVSLSPALIPHAFFTRPIP